MKATSIKEIKQALQDTDPAMMVECCLRLARFKQENKELLTYLLFEAHDENSYVAHVKESLEELFTGVNTTNLYYAKKNIRKIVRLTNKYIRYSGQAVTEAELLIFVADKIRSLKLDMDKSPALLNLYHGLLKKIDKSIRSMHEDLQYDFNRQWMLLKQEP